MKAIGITCEYNPFHKGHQHQLHTLARTAPDALRIAVMSGSFVQRGEPAYFSKFDRARWAVLSGADAVIELPAVYALGSAEIFATGAVRLMKALHIDTLSFGTEYDNLSVLWDMAQQMSGAESQQRMSTLIKEGLSYGTAMRRTLEMMHPHGNRIIASPNAILGLEYLKAALLHHTEVNVIPILRTSDHHSTSLVPRPQESDGVRSGLDELPSGLNGLPSSSGLEGLPSGSALRKALIQKKDISHYLPEAVAADMRICIKSGAYIDYNRYYDIVQTVNRLHTVHTLESIADFTEGIEHRWYKASLAASWPEALEMIKTKRYTYTRLNRMAAYTVLGIQKDLMAAAHREGPPYARLLAFNSRARQWLRQEFEIPVLHKWASAPEKVSSFGQELLSVDTKATDIQHLSFTGEGHRQGHRDYIVSPQYIEI